MRTWSISGEGNQSGMYIIDDFLTAKECREIVRYAKKTAEVCPAFSFKKGDKRNDEELSMRSFFYPDTNDLAADIFKRGTRLTGLPLAFAERIKLIGYMEGGSLQHHNDYNRRIKDRKKRRIAQILIYLNDVEEGGETYFKNLGLKIVPKAGRALVWYGIQGMSLPKKRGAKTSIPEKFTENIYSVHTPLPTVKGHEKWVAILVYQTHPIDHATEYSS